MTGEAAAQEIDWSYEFTHHTTLWSKACTRRWQLAEEMINAGHHLVWIKPLSKSYIHNALRQPVTDVKVLREKTKIGGKFRDNNYGIITGQGRCLVIDIDNKKSKEGEVTWNRHTEDLDCPLPTGIVLTPSGGRHLYYAADERMRGVSPWSKEGVDIASSNGPIPTQHVVGPGSIVYWSVSGNKKKHRSGTSGEYEPLEGRKNFNVHDLVALPEELINRILASKASMQPVVSPTTLDYATGGRGFEGDIDEASPKLEATEIHEVLAHIPCPEVSRDEWLRVGFALHHWDREEGFDFWNDWSATDKDRYSYKEVSKLWMDMNSEANKDRKPVTIATAIAMAKSHGYEPKGNAQVMGMFAKMDDMFGMVAFDEPKYTYIKSNGEAGYYKKDALRQIISSYIPPSQLWVTKDDGKRVHILDEYHRWPYRKIYETIGFYPPGGPECPEYVRNTWRGYAVEPKPGDISPYLELTVNMFPDIDVRAWVHDWFAHMYQKTGEKIVTALVLHGSQGTGKNTLINVHRQAFLQSNTMEFNSTKQFLGKFNDFVSYSTLVVANEAQWAGNHEHFSLLKGFIADEYFRTEEKFQRGTQKRNCARFVLMTNDEWAVAAEQDDRRFCVCEVPKIREPHDPWWQEMRKWIQDKANVAAVMHWYLQRDITHNLAQTPKTESLERQKAVTVSRRLTKEQNVHVNTLTHLMRVGKATHRNVAIGTITIPAWVVSNEMLKRSYGFANDEVPNDTYPLKFRQFMANSLKLAESSNAYRVKYENVQRRCTMLPPMHDLRRILGRFLAVDPDSFDAPDEWSEDGIEW